MSAIEEKTYLLCNYSASRVIVSLRDTSMIIEGSKDGVPSAYPFTASELIYINNSSSCIRNGSLIPSEDDKEQVYALLRITDWKNILTNKVIEEIILNPTIDALQRILDIKDPKYFERVYGIYIGLRNANAPITANVSRIISGRYKELLAHKKETDFVLKKKDVEVPASEDVDTLKAEMAKMKVLLEQALKASANSNKSDEMAEKPAAIEATETPKPVAKKPQTRTKQVSKTRK